ncbi:MAG: TonB family protein [Chthoniobacterales bacterium]|nr:TonB family protein [Chthoniobacterales bacterium]
MRLRAGVDAATGSVVRVSVVQSSGYKNLDGAAVRALRQWRFKPHTVEWFVVPFTFALKGGFNQQLEAARAHALASPSPRYPLRARYDLLQGEGVYEFMIDYDSGEVTKVNVLRSTDSVLLDEAAVSAFRQWRFTPRTLRTLRVPLRFSFYDEAHTHNNAGH